MLLARPHGPRRRHAALAELRANEARYFKNKYDHVFVVEPAGKAKKLIDYVHRILKQEREIVIRGSYFVIKGEY